MVKTDSSDWRALSPPGYDPWRDAGDFRFREDLANYACDFFAECLTHHKGAHAGRPFELEPWQRGVIGHLWGWRGPDGRRRYRECFMFVARKNGKTHMAAGLALLLLFCDGERGAEVYSAAAEKEQAALVFDAAKTFTLEQPALAKHAKVYRRSIALEATGGCYKALSSEAKSKHGFNASGLIIDELHAIRDRELVDVLTTATGSRPQPLTVYLTTAGFDRYSICYEKYDYARAVRDGDLRDAAFLPAVWETDPDDDWTDPNLWRLANPNLGVSVNQEYLERECTKAIDTPGYENTFRRLHLNQWTEQDARWLSMEVWDRGDVELPDLEGRECFAGLDLSSTVDLTALVLVFPDADGFWVLPFVWIPSESAHRREKHDRAPYVDWIRSGDLEATDGRAVNYGVIRKRLNELGERFNIRKIAVDRWNASQLIGELEGDGFSMMPFGQGYKSMNAPSKQLEALLLDDRLWHGGHPVLRWCARNVCRAEDPAGNIKPDKKASTERIDPIVALVMALGAAAEGQEPTYDGPGVWT